MTWRVALCALQLPSVLIILGQGTSGCHAPGLGFCSSPPTRPQAACPASSPSAPSAPDQKDRDSHPTRGEKVCHCPRRVRQTRWPPQILGPWPTHRGLGREGLNTGCVGGDGQDVELVINDKTLLTGGQRKNKPEEQNHHSEVLGGEDNVYTAKCG